MDAPRSTIRVTEPWRRLEAAPARALLFEGSRSLDARWVARVLGKGVDVIGTQFLEIGGGDRTLVDLAQATTPKSCPGGRARWGNWAR
jgi:hypothetical protein